MRKFLISLLLASAAVTPAVASAQQSREDRQQARQERQTARDDARAERSASARLFCCKAASAASRAACVSAFNSVPTARGATLAGRLGFVRCAATEGQNEKQKTRVKRQRKESLKSNIQCPKSRPSLRHWTLDIGLWTLFIFTFAFACSRPILVLCWCEIQC